MAIQDFYRDPLFIKWYTDPVTGQEITTPRTNESHKIINNIITLAEIPSEYHKVNSIIIGSTPVYEVPLGTILDENHFSVNYTQGLINLNSTYEGRTAVVPEYNSRGFICYPASRVYYELNTNGTDIQSTLQDYVNSIVPYSYKNIWNSTTTYVANNQVYYNGSCYICTVSTSLNNLPTDTNFWRILSAGFNEMGLYDSGTQYYPRDVIDYNYALYVCKVKPSVGTLPTNITYFDKLLSVENVQTLINNTRHRGNYDNSTQYYQNNIVYFNRCSFMAKQNTVGNEPPIFPVVENDYWYLMAAKGADGVSLNWQGTFDINTEYSQYDLVYYSASTPTVFSGTCVAKQTTIGNIPTNTIYWDVFLEGGGDMAKSVYDTNNNGIVDNSEKLGGELPSYYATSNEIGILSNLNTTDKSSLVSAVNEVNTDLHSHFSDNVAHASKFEKGVAATMTYNAIPRDAKILRIYHGDDTTPTTDGITSSFFVQRVDNSFAGDDTKNNASVLIPATYAAMKRKATGRGWLYTNLNYMEDDSNISTSQSVACAGMAYATGIGSVWGQYGDAYSYNPLATITGGEFDAQNFSGQDYVYNATSPTTVPFSTAAWCMSFGNHNNSFGIGVGGNTSKWGAGMYFALDSCKTYGIDMQAAPSTLINFKYGTSVDGLKATFAGIGLDTGSNAFYTTASGATRQNTGAIHLRGHRICLGDGIWMQWNAATSQVQVGITNSSGVDTVWASIGSASGWVASGTAPTGAC